MVALLKQSKSGCPSSVRIESTITVKHIPYLQQGHEGLLEVVEAMPNTDIQTTHIRYNLTMFFHQIPTRPIHIIDLVIIKDL